MSFFFLLLLFLFVWFIVVPVLRGIMVVNRFRNNARDMFNRAAGRSGGKSQERSQGAESVKRKKIDASVGEYVEFEEIQVSQSENRASTDDTKSVRIESQIDDVEWEEIG